MRQSRQLGRVLPNAVHRRDQNEESSVGDGEGVRVPGLATTTWPGAETVR